MRYTVNLIHLKNLQNNHLKTNISPHPQNNVDARTEFLYGRLQKCAWEFMIWGEHSQAIKCFDKMLEINPNDGSAQTHRKAEIDSLNNQKRSEKFVLLLVGGCLGGCVFGAAIALTINFLFP